MEAALIGAAFISYITPTLNRRHPKRSEEGPALCLAFFQ